MPASEERGSHNNEPDGAQNKYRSLGFLIVYSHKFMIPSMTVPELSEDVVWFTVDKNDV